MNQEVARLWLNSPSLTTSQGVTGIRSSNNKELTFNIDMRIVLGETLWGKYQNFKMYFTDPVPTISGLSVVTIFQRGLNLIQSSYMGKPPGFDTAISINNSLFYTQTNNFIQIPITKKSKCTLCMKSIEYSTVKCISCNSSLGHIHCFRLWYSIHNKCPNCK